VVKDKVLEVLRH